jgi:prefoldin subunit 5
VDARDSMKRMEALRDERDAKERHITELTSEINKLSNRCEDLLAETRTLRKMANVPANYGINLE